MWREVALTQLLTLVELTFLDGILNEDSTDHKSSASGRRQQQRHHLIISNLVARSWHLPLTPNSSLAGAQVLSDTLLVTAMDCIEFFPNGLSTLIIVDLGCNDIKGSELKFRYNQGFVTDKN